MYFILHLIFMNVPSRKEEAYHANSLKVGGIVDAATALSSTPYFENAKALPYTKVLSIIR